MANPTDSILRRLIPFATLIACVLAGPLPAAEIDAQTREERRKQVEALSEAETARLARNFKAFQELSEVEREDLRQLHAALEQDAKDMGHLRALMADYFQWMATTLTPGQRKELHDASPFRRAELVRKFREEQSQASKPAGPDPSVVVKGRKGAAGLSSADMDAVMKVLEASLLPTLSPEQRTQLDKLQGPARHVFLVEVALTPGRKDSFLGPNSMRLVQSMAEMISDEIQRNRVLRANSPELKRNHLLLLIGRGVGAEVERLKPDEATREQFFTRLKKSQQADLIVLSQQELQAQLTQMYMAEHPELFPKVPNKLTRLVKAAYDQRRMHLRGGQGHDPAEKDADLDSEFAPPPTEPPGEGSDKMPGILKGRPKKTKPAKMPE